MSDTTPQGDTPPVPPAPSAYPAPPAYGQAPDAAAYDQAPPAPPAYNPAPPAYDQTHPAPPAYGQPPQYGQPAQAPYGQAPYGQPQAPYGQAQAPYGQYGQSAPAYAQGYGYAPTPKTNALAIVSLIASIAGFIWILPLVGSVVGVITGHMALNRLKTSGENGRGIALAGTIVGWVGLAFAIIGGIVLISIFAWAAGESNRYGY